ncbi:MAG: hypothetical protein EA412_00750 [Chitinophagaceae bacterium]|nr:MAG: hypothetical protein EA412_00750 [Chitinophagaceae bacterium]
MNTIKLKKDFHKLIDSVDNKKLLSDFYELMKKRVSAKDGQLWQRLTEKEQNELFLALEESENPDQLLSHEDMKNKYN